MSGAQAGGIQEPLPLAQEQRLCLVQERALPQAHRLQEDPELGQVGGGPLLLPWWRDFVPDGCQRLCGFGQAGRAFEVRGYKDCS